MTPTPHDALFKAFFSEPERAAEELRHALGPELARRLDFSTLRREVGSFVDEQLRERHADLLYSIALDTATIRIYVLLEHQSGVDPWMPLRLLRYMLRIWEACLKEQPRARRLPAIVPVVLHHSETGWLASTAFEALIEAPPDAPELLEFVPRFRFALDDLSADSEAAIVARVGSACVRLVLAALRSARGPQELATLLRGWLALMREVIREPDGARALQLVFRYISAVRGGEEIDAIDVAALELGADEEATMRTILDVFEERGLQKGLERGMAQGRRDFLLGLLRRRFGELPEDIVARVQGAGERSIERWGERLLGAGSLAEIFVEDTMAE